MTADPARRRCHSAGASPRWHSDRELPTPEIRSAEWVAVARGPDPEQPGQAVPREYGRGSNPIQALNDLANRLNRLRGD